LNFSCSNVAADEDPPGAGEQQDEVHYLTEDQLAALLKQLEGDAQWYPRVVVAAYAGLRRNELLALTWADVDLDAKVLHVRRALDDDARGEISLKQPKTRAGVRSISLPQIAVEALRAHKVRQLETALLLGLGRPSGDALAFPGSEGGYDNPRPFSLRWLRKARKLGVAVHWHGLRHTHASQLIHANLPITLVAARLGHSSPMTTLKTYAHLFSKDDEAAAQAIDAGLGVQ
jgi:integrase